MQVHVLPKGDCARKTETASASRTLGNGGQAPRADGVGVRHRSKVTVDQPQKQATKRYSTRRCPNRLPVVVRFIRSTTIVRYQWCPPWLPAVIQMTVGMQGEGASRTVEDTACRILPLGGSTYKSAMSVHAKSKTDDDKSVAEAGTGGVKRTKPSARAK